MDQDQVTQIIAIAAYTARLSYYKGLGDLSHPKWDELEGWRRDDEAERVALFLNGITPERSHSNWLSIKSACGWTFGPQYDSNKKQHPDMVPYERLSMRRRIEDEDFLNVVRSLGKNFSAVFSVHQPPEFPALAYSQTG